MIPADGAIRYTAMPVATLAPFSGPTWYPIRYLISWLEDHPIASGRLRAVTIGCGVGDDAEALSAHGYQVTTFDISPSAIDLCRKRYPRSRVEYVVADLFDHPKIGRMDSTWCSSATRFRSCPAHTGCTP